MMESLIWRNATRVHDWHDLRIPLRIIDAWISLRLVAAAEWMQGSRGKQRKISVTAEGLGDLIRNEPRGRDERIMVFVGGSEPQPWNIAAVIFPKGVGMSLFNLTVECGDALPSSSVMEQRFLALYSPEIVDAAYIHADPQWKKLTADAYIPPLVTTPTFAGVFWANFLGPGHLANFDVAKLQSIEAYRTKWHGKTGLSLVSAPTLDDALTTDGEKELLRLTAEFRAAKVN